MIIVPRDASTEQVLEIVRAWVDVLAQENYDAAFAELGYLMAGEQGTSEAIRSSIQRYRSPEYYPDTEVFVVSNWRTAQGGNPHPKQEVTWYRPVRYRMAGAVALDLPLNGRWSDLTADFVLWDDGRPEGYSLALEEISSTGSGQEQG